MSFAVEADLILHNGRIWRGREAGTSQALAVWQGKVATGSDTDILNLGGAGTETIDLKCCFASPGLVDNYLPTLDDLDRAAPDHPVVLVRACGHVSKRRRPRADERRVRDGLHASHRLLRLGSRSEYGRQRLVDIDSIIADRSKLTESRFVTPREREGSQP